MEFFVAAPQQHQNRERQRARELRRSAWWQQKIARGVCHYCGQHFSKQELTMDHVIPIVRGGFSNKGNLVVACKTCNHKKKYLTPVEQILSAPAPGLTKT